MSFASVLVIPKETCDSVTIFILKCLVKKSFLKPKIFKTVKIRIIVIVKTNYIYFFNLIQIIYSKITSVTFCSKYLDFNTI